MTQRGGSDLTVEELLERNMALGEYLAAAKRIIDRMVPKRDGLTVDQLIEGEVLSLRQMMRQQ